MGSVCFSFLYTCDIAVAVKMPMYTLNRVKKILPPKGHVGIMTITDKQFGMMELFYGKEEKNLPDHTAAVRIILT